MSRAVLCAVFLCLLATGGRAEAGRGGRGARQAKSKLAPRTYEVTTAPQKGGGIRTTRTTYVGKGRKRRPVEVESIVRAPRGRLMEHELISPEAGTRHHVEHQKSGRKIMHSYRREVVGGVLHETLLGTRTLEPGELDDD